MKEHSQPKAWQKMIHRVVALRPVTWIFSLCLPFIDRQIITLSGGRSSLTSLLAGFPIVTLRSIGAKSGKPRNAPLVGIPVDDRYVLIASNWGQHHHPAWYHNLLAHPEAQLMINGETRNFIAREVTGDEREAYWQRAVEVYIGYAAYKVRAGNRTIPVMLLSPADGTGAGSHS